MALALGALAAAPAAATPLPALLGLLPVLVGATLMAHLVTAALLFSQGSVSGRGGPVRLGSAYLFSAALAVPYVLGLPGVSAYLPAGAAWQGGWVSVAWAWCAGHIGFAALVARYALRPAQDGPPRLRAAVLAVLASAAVVTALLPGAERLVEDAGLGWLASAAAGPAVALSSLGALALLTRRLREGSVVDLWLSVALLAMAADAALTVLGGARFSLGWYFGRGASFLGDMLVLHALLREVTWMHHSASVLAEADALTGLANRRRFDRALALEWRRAQREQQPLALVMLDVDYFKGFNDRYGHLEGDACLRRIAALLTATTRRPADLAARLGGEEFAVLLPGTDTAGAAYLARDLLAALAALGIPHGDGIGGVVTLSAGVAALCPAVSDFDSAALIQAADRALYRAKAEGRGRVVLEQQALVA